MPVDVIHRLDVPIAQIDLRTHSITGWPQEGPCVHCGARSALLTSTGYKASYECRGTPEDRHSAYGPDRCGKTFIVKDPTKESQS